MTLSTGKTPFTLDFDNGDKETIYINIHDRGIRERISAFSASVEKRIKAINLEKHRSVFDEKAEFNIGSVDDLMNMSAEQLEDLQKRLDAVSRIEDEYNGAVKEELDAVFQSKISTSVFKYCEPFDMVIMANGEKELYIMQFLKWLAKELEKIGADSSETMQKYIRKYAKR